MSESGVLYFAYGSNLDTDQMQRRCPGATVAGPARLPGHRLAFDYLSRNTWQGGVADVVPSPRDEVWGLLYHLTPEDLASLDGHEGHPHVYKRQEVRVQEPSGGVHTAWTYMVVQKSPFIAPSAKYLTLILTATERWGFPEAYRQAVRSAAEGKEA